MTSKSSSRHPDGVWIIDAQGHTLYANERMCEILAVQPTAIMGRDSFDFIFTDDIPAARKLFAQKQAGSSAPFRFKLRRDDGTCVWTDVQGTPMHNAAGAFIGIVGTFTVSPSQCE